MTTRRNFIGAGLAVAGSALAGCGGTNYVGDGWQTVLNGNRPAGWTELGEGNWTVADGTLQGNNGKAGYLVSKDSYTDFEMRVEFWANTDTNSGVFIRCQDRNKVGAANSYEVNIWDVRPEPKYGTGAIVDFAEVNPMPKAGNRWNVYEITARGDHLVVVLNGQKTVDIRNAKYKSGPFALQSAGGLIRFKRVDIRTL
jgi:hypothetical protein